MEKYDLLPKQLLYEGTLQLDNFYQPECIEDAFLEPVHDKTYLKRLFNLELTPREQRVTGFVHNQNLIKREKMIMEGTRKACDFALKFGFAANIAGGTHHAFSDRGEGFCLLNDHAIAANYLRSLDANHRILIVDLDVHQGNGTAQIFKNTSEVFTFSMHGKDNYPLNKELSDLNVELPFNCSDQAYVRHLERSLDEVLNRFQPTFVLYQSGVDVLASDKLGKMALTMEGLKQRDKIVLDFVKDLQIPLVAAMGGGYSKDVKAIVDAHASLFRQIQLEFF